MATIARPMPAIEKIIPQKPFDLLRALSLPKRLSNRVRRATSSAL